MKGDCFLVIGDSFISNLEDWGMMRFLIVLTWFKDFVWWNWMNEPMLKFVIG